MKPEESFVEQPIRSLQTMLRVIAEDDPRFLTVIPDGIYGPSTMQAVATFQRKNGLPANGITDQNTWEIITQKYELALVNIGKAEPIEITMDPGKVYKLNESSPYIFLLQGMLTQLSMDHPLIAQPSNSGILDEATTISLTAFQTLSGLPATGELDKVTWKHLTRQFTLNAHHNIAIQKMNSE